MGEFDDETLWSGQTVIETARLKLRGFLRADLPLFAEMHLDAEVMQFIGGVPLPSAITDGIAGAAQRSFVTTGFGKIAVERRSDGAFLGMAGLSVEDWYPNDLEIGWRLAREYWGEGYATEAGSAWLAHAFDALGAPRVISVADVPNRRSVAVMERIGLTLDHHAELADASGTFPAVVYAMTAAAWRDRQAHGARRTASPDDVS